MDEIRQINQDLKVQIQAVIERRVWGWSLPTPIIYYMLLQLIYIN